VLEACDHALGIGIKRGPTKVEESVRTFAVLEFRPLKGSRSENFTGQ